MKKVSFRVQKWSARAIVAIGALLGISACSHSKRMIDYDGTPTPPIHNLKYGPLVNVKVSQEATLVKKRIDKEGNVVYDTISNSGILSPKVPTPLNEEE